MPPVLELASIALPFPALVAFAAIGLGLLAGLRSARTTRTDAGWPLVRVLLVGLLVARLAYVWAWRGSFARNPAAVLDLTDGGWEVGIGAGAAFLYGLSLVKRDAKLKRPLVTAGVVATFLGLAGTLTGLAWPRERLHLPALSLQTLEGHHVPLASFVGQPTVVNLWASWCPPCRREMPLLAQAQAAHGDVNVVFLNQGESARLVNAYLAAEGLRLGNVLLDPHLKAGNSLGRLALPTTLFFDAHGRFVSRRIGELSEELLRERLSQARGEP